MAGTSQAWEDFERRTFAQAAELRAVVTILRHRATGTPSPGTPAEAIVALADWLAVKATNLEHAAVAGHHYRDHDYEHALAVARAYIGSEDSEED